MTNAQKKFMNVQCASLQIDFVNCGDHLISVANQTVQSDNISTTHYPRTQTYQWLHDNTSSYFIVTTVISHA